MLKQSQGHPLPWRYTLCQITSVLKLKDSQTWAAGCILNLFYMANLQCQISQAGIVSMELELNFHNEFAYKNISIFLLSIVISWSPLPLCQRFLLVHCTLDEMCPDLGSSAVSWDCTPDSGLLAHWEQASCFNVYSTVKILYVLVCIALVECCRLLLLILSFLFTTVKIGLINHISPHPPIAGISEVMVQDISNG